MTTGSRLGHYQLGALLGEGGMGRVFRAHDTKLGRDVALKVLPLEVARDPDRLARFRREAQTLAALDHPAIVTVYSVEEDAAAGVHFLTMQLVEGQSLDRALPGGGLPLPRFIEVASALAGAVAAAHDQGIVHRDLKPANVMLASDGRVKVLDFGIAKAIQPAEPGDATRTSDAATAAGAVMGTPAYMSPEQIEGRLVLASSDVFSLGVVLHEIATGRRPFQGASSAAVMSVILTDAPAPPSQFLAHWPKADARALDAIVAGCLRREAARRPTARAVADALRAMGASARAAGGRGRARVFVPAAFAVAALGAYVIWTGIASSRRAVLVAESLPRIEALARDGRFLAAFELARAVERAAGAAAVSGELWDLAATRVSVVSEPAGASVTLHPFGHAGAPVTLGAAPLEHARVPRGAFHWRVELAGHLPADFVTGTPPELLRFNLRRDTDRDREMVLVPGGPIRLWTLGGVKPAETLTLAPFLIDRREVTNREFAAFVAAGGYARRDLWRHAFTGAGRTLSFDDAMARFRDATGRPGPATWRLGAYPDGEEDLPVTGLSWYEAAAYAVFAGRELPSLYHWYQADTAGDIQLLPGLVLPTANHEGPGPRPAGASSAMSAYGAVDMAGNVREWVVNESDRGTRLALGGAWSDPGYLYLFPEARSPFDRAPGNGMRTIRRMAADPQAVAVEQAPLPARPSIDRRHQRPVSDAEYAVFTRFYERRTVPVDARIEATDEAAHWTRLRVSFAAGYGAERAQALLYLPKGVRAPYQTVIFMAGAAAFYRRSSATERDVFGWSYAEYLVRGGRAVMMPVWKGSYERADGFHPLQTEWPSYREHVIQWVTELHQAVDYLQSRDDIARDAIGYQGVSNGSIWGPIFLALEPRLRTGIFILGGLLATPIHDSPMPAEIDAIHFAPRVTVPVLMLNGRHDAIFPYEMSQVPLYRLLGSAPGARTHLTFPGGHSSFGWMNELIREGLDWLDRWFGPVAR